MRLAFRDPRVASDRPRRSGRRRDPSIQADWPSDIAFLRRYGVNDDILHAAVRSGMRASTTATTALLAGGEVSDTHFFFSFARHLGLSFVWDWPALASSACALAALRDQHVCLADGRWLVAPTAAKRAVLLEAHRRGIELPAISITTPARFQAIIRRELSGQIARSAGEALANAAPELSARGASTIMKAATALVLALTCLAGIVGGIRPLTDALGAVFFAALVFRLLVAAAGLPSSEVEQEDAAASHGLSDAEAPTYSVLVPLLEEPDMVRGLVAALGAINYPRSKLEILFLVEAHDTQTRVALLAAALPAYMRVVIVPDGEPRTKPRALNAGLLFASGALVTVFDAEDRPDPDQLRRAAARFARGPADLACVQARLAISNGAEGVIPRLFAIEYAALFDIFNVGAARLALPMALGGTSNHFRGMG